MQTNHQVRIQRGQAFGLVEILVILAVIAVIAVIAFPDLIKGRQAQEAVPAAAIADPLVDLVARAAQAGAVDSAGNAPTIEGITAGTVYTTPDGVVFSMESVQVEQ